MVSIGLILVGGLIVFFATMAAIPERMPKPRWVAADGPPPADFMYAMFPISNAVALRDAPDGQPAGVLTRAVANSQEEVAAGGWIKVQDPAGAKWVALDQLAYLPPPGAQTDYFAAFDAAYRARAPADFRSASFKLRATPDGARIATLELRQDDYFQEYVYQVSPGPPKALEFYEVFGPGWAMLNLDRFGAAIIASAAFMTVTGAGSVFTFLRRDRRRRQPAPAATHAPTIR